MVAGTSAGASAMSTHMVAFGASGGTPKQRMVQMAAGLGVLPGVIVDQHFQQRNRLGRLLATIAQNPALLGLGIDEDTCGRRVAGHGHGGHRPAERDHRGRRRPPRRTPGRSARIGPIMISNVVLHSLPVGYRFDLRRRVRVAAPMLRALDTDAVASS